MWTSAKWRLGLLEEGKIVFVIFPSETAKTQDSTALQIIHQADYSRKSEN
jgi:hypothetical protein